MEKPCVEVNDGDNIESDDEIHVGPLTLKAIKKIFRKELEAAKTRNITTEDSKSLRHEETQQPNADSDSDPVCSTAEDSKLSELDNTFDVMDYLLNNGPNLNKGQNHEKKSVNSKGYLKASLPIKIDTDKELTPVKDTLNVTEKTELKGSPKYFKPCKSVTKKPLTPFVSPSSSSIQSKSPIFKTPSFKTSKPKDSKDVKQSTPMKTPVKKNAYQHITSPIASYIKNCPKAPLLKDVHPKQPLPSTSLIPRFVGNPSHGKIEINKKNNVNINLPTVAYKSAKQTKVIEVPDENKSLQSQWVKKSFPRPTVMTHEKREMNPIKKQLPSNQEDSFNITCNQADVSHCTQKSAFKSTNKK